MEKIRETRKSNRFKGIFEHKVINILNCFIEKKQNKQSENTRAIANDT